MAQKDSIIIPDEIIADKIYLIRGEKIMLDQDLAILYGVENKQLKRQVRRNIARFPSDFMFELKKEEWDALRSQIGTLKKGQHPKYAPMVFTEQGIAMLSSVLNSDQAIKVNIQIIRLFTRMRKFLMSNKEILLKLQQIENKVIDQEGNIKILFQAMKELIRQEETPRKEVRFKIKAKP